MKMDYDLLKEFKKLSPEQKDAFFKWILSIRVDKVRDYGVNSVVLFRTKRRIRNGSITRISKTMIGMYKAYKDNLAKEAKPAEAQQTENNEHPIENKQEMTDTAQNNPNDNQETSAENKQV